MNTKLTLTIEQSVINLAKKYAKERKRSLSDLIENYLKSLTSERNEDIQNNYSPEVDTLIGCFKEPNNFDYKKDLTQILSEKHLEND